MQTWVCLLTGLTLYYASLAVAQEMFQNPPNSVTETIQTVTTTTENNSLSTQDDNSTNQHYTTTNNTTIGVRSPTRPFTRNEQLLAVLANRRRQIIENRFKNHIKTIVELAKYGSSNISRKNQTGDLIPHHLITTPNENNTTVNIHLKISDLINENSTNPIGNEAAKNTPVIRNILFRRKMNYLNKKLELGDLEGEISEIGKNIDGLTDPEDSLQVEESSHDKLIYYDAKNISKSMNNFDTSEELKTISLNNKNYTKENGTRKDLVTPRKTKENLKVARNNTHFMSQSVYNHFRPPEEIPLEEMQPFLHFGDKIPTPKPENPNTTPNQIAKLPKDKGEKVSKEEILPKLESEVDENMDVSILKQTNFENKIPKTSIPNPKTTIVQQYIKNRSYNVTKSLAEKNNTRSAEKVFPKIRGSTSRNRGFRNRTIFFLQKRNGMRQTINLNPNTSIANLRPPSSTEILETQNRSTEQLNSAKSTTEESVTPRPRTTKALPLTQESLGKTTTEVTKIAKSIGNQKTTEILKGPIGDQRISSASIADQTIPTVVHNNPTVKPTTNILTTDVVTSISISSSKFNKSEQVQDSEDSVIAKLNNFTYQSFQNGPEGVLKNVDQSNLQNKKKNTLGSDSEDSDIQEPNSDGDLDPTSTTLDLEGSYSQRHNISDFNTQKPEHQNKSKGTTLNSEPKIYPVVENRFYGKDEKSQTSESSTLSPKPTPGVSKETSSLYTPKGFTPVLRRPSPTTQGTKQTPIFYLNKTDFIIHVPEGETTTFGTKYVEKTSTKDMEQTPESTTFTTVPKTRSTTQKTTKNIGFFNLFNSTTGELPLTTLFNAVESRKEVETFNGTKILLGETIISRKNATSFDNVNAAYILASLGLIPMLVIVVYVVRNFIKRKNKCFENFDTELQDDKANFITPVVRQSSMMSETSPPPIPQSKWEFPRSKLRLQTLLGQGNFGQVWKAEADDLKGHIGLTRLVAVKTIKNDASDKDKQDLLKELAIMQKMGSHPNVVTLLGCCTEKEPYLVIMEYVMYGKLLTYLRDHRTRRDYFNFSDDAATLTSRDLTVFAYCVARGMEYLSSIGIPRLEFDLQHVPLPEMNNS